MERLEYAIYLRDKIGPEKFDILVKMSKCVLANSPKKPDSDFQFKKIPVSRSMNYALDFFSKLNPQYYYRVLNIIRENVKKDKYTADKISWFDMTPDTFPYSDGLGFTITNSAERKIDGIKNERGLGFGNYVLSPSGEVFIDDTQTIETAASMAHELGHKLSLSNIQIENNNSNKHVEDEIYRETPSITLEMMFFDYLRSIGYNEEEIKALEYERINNINIVTSILLVVNEVLERGEDNPDINEIISNLKMEYPAFSNDESFTTAMEMMFNNDFSYQESVTPQIEGFLPYLIGLIMSSYYKKDYYENKDKAKLFRFIHIYPDNLMTEKEKEQEYKELGLPFEANNIDELINTFEEEYSSKKEQVSLIA